MYKHRANKFRTNICCDYSWKLPSPVTLFYFQNNQNVNPAADFQFYVGSDFDWTFVSSENLWL